MYINVLRTTFAAALLAIVSGASLADDSVLAIKTKRIYPGSGEPIDAGVLLIKDGKISAIGPSVQIPSGAKVLDKAEMVITPGLVEACCLVDDEMVTNYFDRSPFAAKASPAHADASQCDACSALHSQHASGPSRRKRDLDSSKLTAFAHAGNPNGPAETTQDPGADPYGPARVADDSVCRTCSAAHRFHYLAHAHDDSDETSVAPNCPVHNPGGIPGASWRSFAANVARPPEVEGACGCACAGPRSVAEQTEALASGIGTRATWAEHASEIVPHTLVLDSVNLFSNDFDRLLKSGITTVYVSPDPASVIGARGAIVKTGGDLNQRIVRRADAVKATIGADPVRRGRFNIMPGRGAGGGAIDVFTRRPMTRMGVEWVFRKAFYDAKRYGQGLEYFGADSPPLAACPPLLEILKGEIGLRVQARMQHDILTALRLAEEFGLKITIDEGTDAHLCIPELKASEASVVYGPIFFNPSGFRVAQGEVEQARLSTPKKLHDAGVRFALSALEFRDEEGLVRQAMCAAREGLPRDVALAAITSTPAAILGVEDEVGTLKNGGTADLVVWSGDPLDATSKVQLVMIGGKVAYEAK